MHTTTEPVNNELYIREANNKVDNTMYYIYQVYTLNNKINIDGREFTTPFVFLCKQHEDESYDIVIIPLEQGKWSYLKNVALDHMTDEATYVALDHMSDEATSSSLLNHAVAILEEHPISFYAIKNHNDILLHKKDNTQKCRIYYRISDYGKITTISQKKYNQIYKIDHKLYYNAKGDANDIAQHILQCFSKLEQTAPQTLNKIQSSLIATGFISTATLLTTGTTFLAKMKDFSNKTLPLAVGISAIIVGTIVAALSIGYIIFNKPSTKANEVAHKEQQQGGLPGM